MAHGTCCGGSRGAACWPWMCAAAAPPCLTARRGVACVGVGVGVGDGVPLRYRTTRRSTLTSNDDAGRRSCRRTTQSWSDDAVGDVACHGLGLPHPPLQAHHRVPPAVPDAAVSPRPSPWRWRGLAPEPARAVPAATAGSCRSVVPRRGRRWPCPAAARGCCCRCSCGHCCWSRARCLGQHPAPTRQGARRTTLRTAFPGPQAAAFRWLSGSRRSPSRSMQPWACPCVG